MVVRLNTMGVSPAGSRLKLSGCEQAQRHREVCKRGHGITPLFGVAVSDNKYGRISGLAQVFW